jgi:hypothetical protein
MEFGERSIRRSRLPLAIRREKNVKPRNFVSHDLAGIHQTGLARRFAVAGAHGVAGQQHAASVGQGLVEVHFEIRIGHIHRDPRHQPHVAANLGVFVERRAVINEAAAEQVQRLGFVRQGVRIVGRLERAGTEIQRIVDVVVGSAPCG